MARGELVSPTQQECDSNARQGEQFMFVAKVGDFSKGVQWISETVGNMKRSFNIPENWIGVLDKRIAEGQHQNASVSRKTRHRCEVSFARVADVLDHETQVKLKEVQEDVVETAKELRVPVPAANLPYIGHIRSLSIKQLLCGVLAGAVASTAVVPFDVIQSRVVAGQGGRTVAEVVGTVAREEGLHTLMKGSLSFNIIKNAVEKGLQFTTFEAVKRGQERRRGKDLKVLPLPRAISISTFGGATAGLIGTLLSYPLQPIMARCLLQPDKYKSTIETLKEIVRNEGGFRELYRGVTPALISMIPSAALSFFTYETLKNKYLSDTAKKSPEAFASLVIGGVAGAISTTLTYPLEEARKQIVYSALSPKALHMPGDAINYSNTWQAINGILKREGVRGLYRGLTASNLQIVPMTAITFMVYELAKRALVAHAEEDRDEVMDASNIPPDQAST